MPFLCNAVSATEVLNALAQIIIAVCTVATLICLVYQVVADKRRTHAEQISHQARQIACWEHPLPEGCRRPTDQRFVYVPYMIRNGSDVPIYEVVVTEVGQYGAGPREKGEENPGDFPDRVRIPVIGPGTWGIWLPTGGGGMGVRVTAEIAFIDAANRYWVRRGNGVLESIQEPPLAFYSSPFPPAWSNAIPLD